MDEIKLDPKLAGYLLRNDILEIFMSNVLDFKTRNPGQFTAVNKDSLVKNISRGFAWKDTKQGHEYWRNHQVIFNPASSLQYGSRVQNST